MSRLTKVRLACLAAVLLLAFDKYSWGELNPPFGILGEPPVGGRFWQSIVALILIALLAYVASSVASRPRTAMQTAIIELGGFVALNGLLVARDGVARLAEWGYAETSVGLFLVVGGIAARGLSLGALAAEFRAAQQQEVPAGSNL
jgi:hypothetical protein